MLEHLIHIKTWFNRFEADQAEQKHFSVFGQKPACKSSTEVRTQQHTTVDTQKKQEQKPIESKPAPKPAADDDDVDLFGSEDEEESELTKQRLAAYAEKKGKKEQVIAKSSILLDVKPWDDETDLDAMEKAVRSIEADGLIWGQSKRIPVAYGVMKLQIGCVVEDDKIGTDFLEENICAFEDYIQSVDIASFNKI